VSTVKMIEANGSLLAIYISASYEGKGIEFFTPEYFSQQLGYMNRPKGYSIPPHEHNSVSRQVQFTNEVLFIKSGRVRVDFYENSRVYLESRVLEQGDILLLAFGGHGFEMLEPSEIIEVKQGPYSGEADKTRFEPVAAENIRLVGSSDEF
jgi:mannose-6-phosphate isomerase-like protein (cupin superfamily)